MQEGLRGTVADLFLFAFLSLRLAFLNRLFSPFSFFPSPHLPSLSQKLDFNLHKTGHNTFLQSDFI